MDLFSESLERGDEVAGEDRSILAVSANGPGQTGGANRVGIVVIGRNEGERLVRCLASVSQRGAPFVYVDSGSSDDSVYHARQLGALVVELDSSEPFTAARARNAGFAELIRAHPEVELVQFVDGDCELRAGWLQAGGSFLSSSPDVGVVCGHLRERAPSSGRYQRLADVEWAGPPGDVRVIGGTCMVRVRTFLSVGGFNTRMIGGEEPEFCLRLSACGLRVVRIDHEMALHEMSIFSVGPWWRRCVRAGHSYAEIYALHRATRDPHWRRKLLSIAVWAVFLPLLILWAASERSAWSLVLLSAYGVLFARIVRSTHARGVDTRTAALYACACIIGKFAELEGVFRFAWARLVRRRPSRLIEYRKRSVEP
jgi:glycosyltransferase involved in cell wall biosynthesis